MPLIDTLLWWVLFFSYVKRRIKRLKTKQNYCCWHFTRLRRSARMFVNCCYWQVAVNDELTVVKHWTPKKHGENREFGERDGGSEGREEKLHRAHQPQLDLHNLTKSTRSQKKNRFWMFLFSVQNPFNPKSASQSVYSDLPQSLMRTLHTWSHNY